MIRTAIIESGIVLNIVMCNPDSDWTPPEGASAVASETAGVGDGWDGDAFTPPTASPDQINAAIHVRLAGIDARSVRPLRAILGAQAAGMTPDPADVTYLADLNTQAANLRAALIT